MSFRFVAVRIRAEGRNLQGSRVVHVECKSPSVAWTVPLGRSKPPVNTRLKKDKRLEIHSWKCIHIK